MTTPHTLELVMKGDLDGTFRAVNKNTGEYADKIVDYGFLPDYTDDHLGVPRAPKKPKTPRIRRSSTGFLKAPAPTGGQDEH
jgi:hypothetical protein